ncbi:hypothetical protein AAF712_006282 [Marasmius tenuissimus]|uniref:Uncharacterized protein n=1 Tax=Marasmius tenuissimus TaxID=585030 RepID=A0ABR2ZZW1_9AGAR
MTSPATLPHEPITIAEPSHASIVEVNSSTQTGHLVRDVTVATHDDSAVTEDTQSTPTPRHRRSKSTEHLPPRHVRFRKLLRELEQDTQQLFDDNDTAITLTLTEDHSLSSDLPTTDVSVTQVESVDTELPHQKRLYGAEHLPARFERSWVTFRDQDQECGHVTLVVPDADTPATGTPLGARTLNEFSNGVLLKRKRDDIEDAQKEQPTKRGRGRPRKVPAVGGEEKAKVMVEKGRKRKDSENVKPSRSSARLQAAANRATQ